MGWAALQAWRPRAMLPASACLLLAALLGACASSAPPSPSPGTGVDLRMIEPAAGSRYEPASHQAFVMAQPLHLPEPVFPQAYLGDGPLPATLCAAVVIDESGVVARTHLVAAPECMPPEQVPVVLESAVREAVLAWRFRPAMLCTYADAATRERDWTGRGCAGAVQEARRLPLSLAWAFTFELQDGQPRVSSARAGGR